MATKLEALKHLIAGFRILDEERCELFTSNLLLNLSVEVENGEWTEEKYPEAFTELRQVLIENKSWYVRQQGLMEELRAGRTHFPRTHWWWWIEELS